MAELVGKTLGRYRVVARLGRGGMAEVYKAYQPGLDRYVGIKVLHSHLVDDADFIGRFEREALAIGKLRHPAIVQALDFDREGDLYFMAMEYIDGPTLKEEMKARRAANQPFTYEEISRIFTALCSAIDYAHARGMVHRDIKPANVMINQEGQIVLTDFGIARIVGATQFTQTGALAGTPAYMSPEQGQGERGDERSDIYSLGVMLYEMVTGTVPYDADTPFAVIMQHISEPLPMPRKINPDIPEGVEKVILKAMSKNPDDRYQSAGAMAKDLRDAVGLAPDDTLHSTPLKTVAPPPKIHQIDHPTGPLRSRQKAATALGSAGEGATVLSPEATAAPARGVPVLPLAIGGAIILVLVVAGVVGAFVLSRPTPTATVDAAATAAVEERETAAAVSAATNTAANNAATTATAETVAAQSAANATGTAAALEVVAPTRTAQAQLDIANTATAQFEQQAGLIQSFLATSEAATAEIATARTATAEASTAEALALVTPTPEATATPIPTDTPTPGPPTNTPTPAPPAEPTATPTPERPPISGKLAFPVDNGGGRYDLFIVSMPDGGQLTRIDGARQPNFRPDGAKLLINGQGGGFGENVFEASSAGTIERAVSGSPTDSHPTYDPYGNRLAYDNPQLAIGSDGNYHSYIFVQCGLIPPSQESEQTCIDVARFGVLVPAGQVGEIQGSNPVWTESDQIVYKGCNSWAGGQSCGVFTVGSWANKRSSNGETPRKIADGTSLTPTDTAGSLVVLHSRESGDWEVYVMGLNGEGLTNLSNSPTSNDGLPTISPDGQWVAFASDRGGGWAVYVVSTGGGAVTKLFDFPKGNPWGAGGDREWTNERMSWGM